MSRRVEAVMPISRDRPQALDRKIENRGDDAAASLFGNGFVLYQPVYIAAQQDVNRLSVPKGKLRSGAMQTEDTQGLAQVRERPTYKYRSRVVTRGTMT